MTLRGFDNRALQPPLAKSGRSRDIADLLTRALSCMGEAWPENFPIARRLRDLRDRLLEKRFQLAVLGQFKRGKSTFLNALLGAPLLPTGVIPLTAIPTFIAWGASPYIRVTYRTQRPADHFDDSTPDDIRNRLFGFVAEEANPKNRLNVARVDLFYPASFLKNGVVLIDTPGIGSTHHHNTDTALQVLPDCDAALFVVSADPPITAAELAYLEEVRSKVAHLLFVLNKADYLEPNELDIAVDFLKRTVCQVLSTDADAEVFSVSALRGLKAKQNGNAAILEESGIASIESYLSHYLALEKVETLRKAVSTKASQLLLEVEADLLLRIRALEMPLEDLAKRGATLENAMSRIANEERIIRDLLAGDRRRAGEQLESHAERLRQKGRQYLMEVLDRAYSQPDEERTESAAQKAVATAIPTFFEQELSEISHEFSQTIEELLVQHQKRINDLVSLVRRTAADLFDVPFSASMESEHFKPGREPYWITQKWDDRLISLPAGFISRLLPAAMRRARLRAQLQAQVSELVQRNVENLRWATLQGLDGTFRRFATMLDERLSAAIEATQGAVRAAAITRSAASCRVDTEVALLQRISDALAEIREALMELATEVGHSKQRFASRPL